MMITAALGENPIGATPLGSGPYFSFLVGNAIGQFALGEAPIGAQYSIFTFSGGSQFESGIAQVFPFIGNMLYFMSHRM